MPGLPKRATFELPDDTFGYHGSSITGQSPLPSPPTPSSPSVMGESIRYVPPLMDPLAANTTRAARQSPLRLLMQDAGVLFTMLPYLPDVFLPLKAKNSSCELHPDLGGLRDIVLQGCLFTIETVLLILAVPAILILPGAASIAVFALSYLIIYLASKPLEGPSIAQSRLMSGDDAVAREEQHKDERWIFINGCATGYSGLQKNIDRISETFGRPVTGIHNKTYGLPGDLLECLIQRVFSYQTRDVRVAHSYIKSTLLDPSINKVVLIGHSQGGIIVSLVLDQLFTELCSNMISKLEVYTFGSAASHFSNPMVALAAQNDVDKSSPSKIHFAKPEPPKHLIPHVEHYANEKDMVPRWGVLHCVQDVLNNRYSGSVFVRMGASGHMFNQHYLDAMFPLPLGADDAQLTVDNFLETLVDVDEKLATRRESAALVGTVHMRKGDGLEFGDGQIIPEVSVTEGHDTTGIDGGSLTNGDTVMTFARTDTGRLLAQEAQGKTVKELSRLWRYQGGRSPHTPTPFPSFSSKDQLLDTLKNGKRGNMKGLSPIKVNGRSCSASDAS